MSKPDDEKVWSSQFDLAEVGGWIHHNNVLFYFARCPFFDRTSNNAVIHSQAMTNPQMFQYITTRELFEARLKSMSGLEYVVVDSPSNMGEDGSGVWVIRKQTRRKRSGEEDEVTVHQSYFIVGMNVYQAPNMADVLTAKIVSFVSRSQISMLTGADGCIELNIESPTEGRQRSEMAALIRSRLYPTQQPAAIETIKTSRIKRRYTNAGCDRKAHGTSYLQERRTFPREVHGRGLHDARALRR